MENWAEAVWGPEASTTKACGPIGIISCNFQQQQRPHRWEEHLFLQCPPWPAHPSTRENRSPEGATSLSWAGLVSCSIAASMKSFRPILGSTHSTDKWGMVSMKRFISYHTLIWKIGDLVGQEPPKKSTEHPHPSSAFVSAFSTLLPIASKWFDPFGLSQSRVNPLNCTFFPFPCIEVPN
jgi:hypothetical protein